jgi:hypothetical protein
MVHIIILKWHIIQSCGGMTLGTSYGNLYKACLTGCLDKRFISQHSWINFVSSFSKEEKRYKFFSGVLRDKVFIQVTGPQLIQIHYRMKRSGDLPRV